MILCGNRLNSSSEFLEANSHGMESGSRHVHTLAREYIVLVVLVDGRNEFVLQEIHNCTAFDCHYITSQGVKTKRHLTFLEFATTSYLLANSDQ